MYICNAFIYQVKCIQIFLEIYFFYIKNYKRAFFTRLMMFFLWEVTFYVHKVFVLPQSKKELPHLHNEPPNLSQMNYHKKWSTILYLQNGPLRLQNEPPHLQLSLLISKMIHRFFKNEPSHLQNELPQKNEPLHLQTEPPNLKL